MSSLGFRTLRGFLPAAALALFALTLPAQETAVAKPNAMTQPAVVRGQSVFSQNCAACHGTAATGGMGGMGPNLITSSLVRHDVGGGDIVTIVHEGRMDKGMPAFPNMPADQAGDIAAFLHAKVTLASRASALSGSSLSASSLMTGNATAGEKIFSAKCTTCHSATGDLAGIAKKHDASELQMLMLMPKAGPPMGSVTAQGRTVNGTFVHRDEYTVTLREADGSTHTWMTNHVSIKADDPLQGHKDLLPTYNNKDMHDVFAYLETLR